MAEHPDAAERQIRFGRPVTAGDDRRAVPMPLTYRSPRGKHHRVWPTDIEVTLCGKFTRDMSAVEEAPRVETARCVRCFPKPLL